MKKLLYSLLIFASATMFAQKNTSVKFAVGDDIVGTVTMFNANKNFVQSISTFKTKASLPQNLKKFEFLADNGLAEAKLKGNVGTLDNISLAQMNEQHDLPKDNPVFIEGYEFKDTSIKIYANMMQDYKVEDINGKKTLVITTIKK